MKSIKILIDNHEIIVFLHKTETADAVWKASPFQSKIETWGKEIYFDTSIRVSKEEDAKQVLEKGEIAFWVEGHSIAIGFGPTPISERDEIKLVTKANIFGYSEYELSKLSNISSGALVKVARNNNKT